MNNRRQFEYHQQETRTSAFMNRHPAIVIGLMVAVVWVGDWYVTGGV